MRAFLVLFVTMFGFAGLADDVDCSSLSLNDCNQHFHCAIKGQNGVKSHCKKLSFVDLNLKKDYAKQCAETGGKFYNSGNKYGHCACPKPKKDVRLNGCK